MIAIKLASVVLCLAVGLLVVLDCFTEESAAVEPTFEQYVTFYAWLDNDPPGNRIAYPRSEYPRAVHEVAGGTGTYADPLTAASDPTEWPIGTRLYAPFLRKYLVVEDWCEACVRDWRQSRKHHVDVWMNSNQSTGDRVHECAYRWTQDRASLEVNPPRGRAVDTRPLFDTSSNTCLESAFGDDLPVSFRPGSGGQRWWPGQ